MFLLDRLLVGSLTFVLDKIASAVDAELDNDEGLRQQLLDAQMRYELGEIDDAQLAAIERDVLAAIRAVRARRGESPATTEGFKITGVEATVGGDEEQ